MMSNAPPWENLKFSESALAETRSKVFSTLANVYGFFATYANLDRPDIAAAPPPSERPDLDRWILHRLARTVEAATQSFDDYNPTRAARAVEAFASDLSNWYLRRSRRRFWKSEDASDQNAAYATLYACLRDLAVVMSPIAPSFPDVLYRALTGAGDGGLGPPRRVARRAHGGDRRRPRGPDGARADRRDAAF